MKFLVLNIFLASSTAFATNTARTTTFNNNKMDLSFNAKDLSTTKVITKDGETTTITQNFGAQGNSIDVTTTKIDINNNVNVKFTIGTVGKNGENAIMANPKW